MMNSKHTLYWLKRDFRLLDNPALAAALSGGSSVTPIFIIEPSFLKSPDTSAFHVQAILTAVIALKKNLAAKGGELLIIVDEVVPTLEKLYNSKKFDRIVAHQETGTNRTYQRDLAVQDWCKKNSVSFEEHLQTAVFRRLEDRDIRHKYWTQFTFDTIVPVPKNLEKCQIPKIWIAFNQAETQLTIKHLGLNLNKSQLNAMQLVSEDSAHKDLQSFLYERGINYRGGISSPLTAFTAGSRTSVHFAWGTISTRMVYQRTQERMDELKILKEQGDPDASRWRMSLRSFLSRLHWRDHFIQRLESEPNMEFEALNSMYEHLEYDTNSIFLTAWKQGMTGFPMVDACIRCLLQTGFLNFRMRAMITSFACHTLHLDWKLINEPMAKMYTDYEAGIHLSQLQMQASVVGINTVRVYSPTKQIIDQDPEAIFIKEFVPELRPFSAAEIIAHTTEKLGVYPAQLVDWKTASAEMKSRIYAIRKRDGYKEIAQKVYKKHGSRKGASKKKKTN